MRSSEFFEWVVVFKGCVLMSYGFGNFFLFVVLSIYLLSCVGELFGLLFGLLEGFNYFIYV